MTDLATDRWHPVALSAEIGEGPVRVWVADEPWVMARLHGTLTAARDRCPHRGAPLSAGEVKDGCFECPYHGWRFDGTGACVEVPALGAGAPVPPRARLQTAAGIEERDGVVWIDPGDPPAVPARIRHLANDDPALRRFWHPVARSGELVTGGSVALDLLGDRVVISRDEDGVPACDGAHAVTDHVGHLWVAPDEPVAGLLDVPEFGADGWHHVPMPRIEGRYGVGLLLDNQLDAGHFSFVHRATFGWPEGAALPPYTVERDDTGDGFVAVLRVPISARNASHASDGVPLQQHRTMTYRYRAPATLFIRLDYEEMGGSTGILFCFTPQAADRTRVDVDLLFNHPDGFTEAQLAERLAFEIAVVAEDMALQDRFDFLDLPLTLNTEVHTKADRSAVEMRRILAALVTAEG